MKILIGISGIQGTRSRYKPRKAAVGQWPKSGTFWVVSAGQQADATLDGESALDQRGPTGPPQVKCPAARLAESEVLRLKPKLWPHCMFFCQMCH